MLMLIPGYFLGLVFFALLYVSARQKILQPESTHWHSHPLIRWGLLGLCLAYLARQQIGLGFLYIFGGFYLARLSIFYGLQRRHNYGH